MTRGTTANLAGISRAPLAARRRLARTEGTIALLQCVVAFAFVIGAYTGLFDIPSPTREVCAGWVWFYHVGVTVYSFAFRVRGETIPWVEPLVPLLDISCATAVYIALGDPVSPVWAIYLYALMGYSRRYQGTTYLAVGLYTIANLLFGWLAMGNPEPQQFLVMVIMSLAVMALASTMSEAWREAEARIRVLAETDPLTGLANRRTFFEHVEALGDGKFGLLMLDLDHFKRLNDELGHLAGDRTLVAAAETIRGELASNSVAGRYGGEEFIVLLPGFDAPQSRLVGERIRQAIAANTPTTVSVGSTVRRPGEPIDATLRRADELLFVAKRSGRDNVADDLMRFAA